MNFNFIRCFNTMLVILFFFSFHPKYYAQSEDISKLIQQLKDKHKSQMDPMFADQHDMKLFEVLDRLK